MTSRERVLEALRGNPTDRAPSDFSAKTEVITRLKDTLGVETEDEVLLALGVDMRRIVGTDLWSFPVKEDAGVLVNVFGFCWGKGTSPTVGFENYSESDEHLLLNRLLNEEWCLPTSFSHPHVKSQCERNKDFITYGSPWCPFFHELGWLLGQERLYFWMLEKPEYVKLIIDRMVSLHLESCRLFFDETGKGLDIAYFGNDYGTQRGLAISPRMYEEFFRRPQKAFFDLAHDYGYKVMFHSCGAIRDIIPWLIEDGVDILDPIQVRAEGMSFFLLLNDFGDQLTLHGGVDMQQTLPFGNPEDVREEIRSYLRATRGKGRYILSSSQKLLPDVPTENILAMYEENLRSSS